LRTILQSYNFRVFAIHDRKENRNRK